jgi:hypothetical protein
VSNFKKKKSGFPLRQTMRKGLAALTVTPEKVPMVGRNAQWNTATVEAFRAFRPVLAWFLALLVHMYVLFYSRAFFARHHQIYARNQFL